VILIYSFVAGIVTGVGALIAILVKNLSNRVVSLSLGFASGIMIGISTLSLIPRSIETNSLFSCIIGFISGGAFLWLIDVVTPHIHKTDTNDDAYLKMGYFIAIGIAFHNLPEGIAIGTSNSISAHLGLFTAIAIGLHNVAEGLSVAIPLTLGHASKSRIIFITTMTGLSTFLGTIIGLALVKISPLFISYSLAFAAGAMIYISSDELIPHSHKAHSDFANVGLMLGIVMALLIL